MQAFAAVAIGGALALLWWLLILGVQRLLEWLWPLEPAPEAPQRDPRPDALADRLGRNLSRIRRQP